VRKESATIRRMFGAIAPRYDLLNHLLSGGLDVLWRRAAVRRLLRDLVASSGPSRREASSGLPTPSGAPARRAAPLDSGRRVLDLCAGTLDLACALSDSRGFEGRIVALDFALPMLQLGQRKLAGRRERQILPLCGDGLELPLRSGAFDAVMVAFGVRNFEDLDRALAEIRRVLAAGGLLVVLEFSQPGNPLFRGLYRLYSRTVLPALGGAISGHREAYRYLPASVAEFPDARTLGLQLQAAGFEEVRFRTLTAGIVALHEARHPAHSA
jgi:demethylmenaquinone methyltransferase/2-methoxy-6-polyprenyl-1,4-benzoquinol methylase